MLMKELLDYIHELECLQIRLLGNRQWEAARSLVPTIDILRKEYELKVITYENVYEDKPTIR